MIAAKESRFGGVYKFRTTSIISFKQLYSSLLHIHQLTGGVLVGAVTTGEVEVDVDPGGVEVAVEAVVDVEVAVEVAVEGVGVVTTGGV